MSLTESVNYHHHYSTTTTTTTITTTTTTTHRRMHIYECACAYVLMYVCMCSSVGIKCSYWQ